jgi:hypothetical protein
MELRQNLPDVNVPTSSAIHKAVKKFKTTWLVLNKEIEQRCHILTAAKLGDISARMEQSPRKFLNKLSVSHSSAQNATK